MGDIADSMVDYYINRTPQYIDYEEREKEIMEMGKLNLEASVRGTKVITGEVRLSYCNLFQPKSINGQDEKYSVSLIIDKNDSSTVNAIKKAFEQAKVDGAAKLGKYKPKFPLRDGDEEREEDPAYQGKYFLNVNSKNKPGIVDHNVQPILDATELYSGCYGRVSINAYAYNANGNKGVTFGLQNVQKLEDGEPLGGFAPASSDFDVVELPDNFFGDEE